MSTTMVPERSVAEPLHTVKSVAVICNIFSRPLPVQHRSWRPFVVNYPKPTEKYALTVIDPATSYADIGDKKRQEFYHTARAVAADLCQEVNKNAGVDSFLGLFVCEGLTPTPEELANAHEKLNKFLLSQVEEADRIWQSAPRHDLIPGIAKVGAKYLSLNKPWVQSVEALVECPGCGTSIRPGFAVCGHCHAVLDRTKAEELGLVKSAAGE